MGGEPKRRCCLARGGAHEPLHGCFVQALRPGEGLQALFIRCGGFCRDDIQAGAQMDGFQKITAPGGVESGQAERGFGKLLPIGGGCFGSQLGCRAARTPGNQGAVLTVGGMISDIT